MDVFCTSWFQSINADRSGWSQSIETYLICYVFAQIFQVSIFAWSCSVRSRPVPYEYICSRSLSSVCKIFPATSLLNFRVVHLAKTILDMILSFPDYPFRVPFPKSFFIGVSWFSSFIWPPKLYSTTNIIICHYTAGIKLFYPRLLQSPSLSRSW